MRVEYRCYCAGRCRRYEWIEPGVCECVCHGSGALSAVCDVPGGCGHLHVEKRQRVGSRINASLGLCDGCERKLQTVIGELPRDYVRLEAMIAVGGGGGGEPVSRSRELPVPIRLSVEALQSEMVHEAYSWAESVADAMNMDWDTAAFERRRPAARLVAACALLESSVSVLLALRDVVGLVPDSFSEGWVATERSGLDGAVALLDLHRRAMAMSGQTTLVERLMAPCPRCERASLRRRSGSDTVSCSSCGNGFTWREYEELRDAVAATYGPVVSFRS